MILFLIPTIIATAMFFLACIAWTLISGPIRYRQGEDDARVLIESGESPEDLRNLIDTQCIQADYEMGFSRVCTSEIRDRFRSNHYDN